MLGSFVLSRRSTAASFAPTLADRYRHPSGTILTVRRARFWRRDKSAADWAVDSDYMPFGRPMLSLWAEHGFTAGI